MTGANQQTNSNQEPQENTNEQEQAEALQDTDQEATLEGADQSNEEQANTAEDAPKADELKDQLLRTLAELDNTRKRHKTQLDDTNKYAVSKFARDLIEVVENLYRAIHSVDESQLEENAPLKQFYDGVLMTKKELLSSFEKQGIQRIAPEKGEAFNHHQHEAVAHVPVPDAEAGSIVDVVQAGYMIHDRLLRPAMVAVAKENE